MARIKQIEIDKFVKIGQRVEVSRDNDEKLVCYASRIEDIESDHIILAMPMEQGYPIIPFSGEAVSIRAVSSLGGYKMQCVYKDKRAQPVPVWVVTKPLAMERQQRREFVRVETMLPLKVQFEDEEGNLAPVMMTYTRDISGGGIRFVFDKDVKPKTRLYIETGELPIVGMLEIWCEVVRTVRPRETEHIYWIGVKFIDLPAATQAKLIRYIFQKQREMISGRN